MKHSKWWIKFFISYIFVGLLPMLLLGCFFYYGNRMSVCRQIEDSNLSSLTQSLNRMDYVIEKMNSIAYHYSGYVFDETVALEKFSQLPQVNETKTVQQLLLYDESIESLPFQMLLYIRGDKNIYTEEGKMLYSDFEDSVQSYGDLTMSSFFKMLNSLKYNTSIKTYQMEDVVSFNKSLTYYLYPIPYMDSLPAATLCFGYRYEDIYGLIENYFGEMTSNIYMYNEYYHNIFTTEAGNSDTELSKQLNSIAMNQKGTGIFTHKIGDKTYVIMRGVSQNSGISMVVINEKDDFYSQLESSQNVLIIVILFLTIVGIILAVVLSRKNYNPIRQLLYQVAGKQSKSSDSGKHNEFEIIQTYWTDIKDKNQELSMLLDLQRPLVVASCLRKLIKGKLFTPEEMDFTLKSANINFSHHYYFVIIIPLPLIDNIEEDYSKRILSVAYDLVDPNWHLYGIDLMQDNSIVGIVNCKDKDVNGEDARINIAKSLKRDIEKNFKMELHFLIGRIYEKISDINTSYIEATVVASDLALGKASNIILFEHIIRDRQDTQYPILEQALYIQCLKQANKEAALKALDEMVAVISNLESFLITQCLCYDIINMIIKTVNQLNGINIKNIDLKNMCSFTSLDEFYQKCKYITEIICIQYETFRETQNLKLRSGVINYVNANYKELSMCLEDVAQQFDLTANYVSRFFKQETGCSFIQYVTMLRMDRAKELLISTNIQIKDIVAEIGYIDVANFVRKFKSYEGITPSQYRERMRQR